MFCHFSFEDFRAEDSRYHRSLGKMIASELLVCKPYKGNSMHVYTRESCFSNIEIHDQDNTDKHDSKTIPAHWCDRTAVRMRQSASRLKLPRSGSASKACIKH